MASAVESSSRRIRSSRSAISSRAPTSWVMSREMPETPTIALALSWIGENVTDTSTRAPSLRKCVVSNRSGGRPSRTCRTIVLDLLLASGRIQEAGVPADRLVGA